MPTTTAQRPSIPPDEIDAFLRAQQTAIASNSDPHDAIAAGLAAAIQARQKAAHDPLDAPIDRSTVLGLMRDPTHPLSKAMALLASCGARIEQDSEQRRPSGPIVWRTWELQTVLAILALFNISSPQLPG